MAKSAFPLKTGTSVIPKLIGLLIVGTFLTLVIREPTVAATLIRAAGGLLGSAIEAFVTFSKELGR